MANRATVVLGEKEFQIRELPTKPAEAWRKRLGDELQPIMNVLQQIPAMLKDGKVGGLAEMEISEQLLQAILEPVKVLAIDSLSTARELVITYSPVLEAERAWLEANACDSEFVEALVECIKLAFPFGSLMPVVQRAVKLGQAKRPT